MAKTSSPLAWRAFRLPRAGHAPEECEDAFAADAVKGRFAVADGASESGYASTWAELLVEGYVRQPGAWQRWLGCARASWQGRLQGRELPWYAEAKRQEGAFSTLLGVAFAPGQGGWRAEAVGDSCLFQVRAGQLRRAFPCRRSEDFDNRPSLLGSHAAPPGRVGDNGRTHRCRTHGAWAKGDLLLLATDALAQWFLREVEEGRQPWRLLADLDGQDAFAECVGALREADAIRNDDVTFLFVAPAERSPS